MYLPEVTVEIAFDAGVLTPADERVWVDVTDYVELDQGIVIQRGRSDEFQVTSPSTLSLTLDNSDGSFTPGGASSTFYPHVKIGRPIRVMADGTVRFTGYVDEWPVEWPSATDSSAHSTLTATSRLARLGEGAELRSVVETEILADEPTAYYPLGESSAATFAQEFTGSDTIGMYPLYPSGRRDITFGTGIGATTDGIPAPQVDPYLVGNDPIRLEAYYLDHPMTECTLELFVAVKGNTDDDSKFLELIVGDHTNPDNYKVFQLLGSASVLVAGYEEMIDGVRAAISAFAGGNVHDGNVHHLAMTYVHHVTDPTVKLYLDGVKIADEFNLFPDVFQATLPDSWYLRVGANEVASGNNPMSVAHVALYDQALTADRIEAHALAGLDGFSTELAGERIERIALYADVELAEVDADPGTVPISHIDTANATVESLLRTVEETEGGILYDARDGTLRFRDRDHRYQATSAFTLDVAAQHVEGEGFRPVLDRSAITNSVTARSLDGALEQRYEDATSAEDYGHRRRDIELATTDIDQLYQAAAWRVNRYKDPLPRFAALAPVDVLTLDAITRDAIRDADISTRFEVANMPAQAPDGVSEFFIEGITETLAPESWRFQFNASPANTYDDLFVLDESELNSDDVLAY